MNPLGNQVDPLRSGGAWKSTGLQCTPPYAWLLGIQIKIENRYTRIVEQLEDIYYTNAE